MKELKKQKLLMVCETLHQQFNAEQWNRIKATPAHLFMDYQQSIVDNLMYNQKLYDKYFHHFYSNHVKLLKWVTLAREKKSQIEPYVFKNLCNKGLTFYDARIKEKCEMKFSRGLHPKHTHTKSHHEMYKKIFDDLLNSKTNKYFEKSEEMEGENLKTNDHDFYIDTFNACNGWKYIFYNYEKHMQGLNDKKKYNTKIRQRENKTFDHVKKTERMNLLDYEHEQLSNHKCRVDKISTVLLHKRTNSTQRFKSNLKKQNIQKIVFVNHQGKPSTYLISKNQPKFL